MVKNPPFNAGGIGSTPGQGVQIPQAMGQLSSSSTTGEPTHHNKDQGSQKEDSGPSLPGARYCTVLYVAVSLRACSVTSVVSDSLRPHGP